MGEQWAFYFDTDKCIGCHACSVSCSQRHGRDSDQDEWRTVKNVTTGTFPDVSSLADLDVVYALCRRTL